MGDRLTGDDPDAVRAASCCDGKEAFTDRGLAAKAARRKPGRYTYRCPF